MMTERRRPTPTGKEFLLNNGVPEGLLGLIADNGLQPDYVNHYIGPRWIMDAKYNPLKDNSLNSPDSEEYIRRLLIGVPTYTEYWKNRISTYNEHVTLRGINPVNQERTLALVTEANPAIETIDILAKNVQAMAKNERLNSTQLVKGFVIITANVGGIFMGEKEYKRIRAEFGLSKKNS